MFCQCWFSVVDVVDVMPSLDDDSYATSDAFHNLDIWGIVSNSLFFRLKWCVTSVCEMLCGHLNDIQPCIVFII